MRRWAVLVSLGFLIPALYAQQPLRRAPIRRLSNAIQLRARVFVPAAGLDERLPGYFRARVRAKEPVAHVLVQFTVVPSLAERKVLEEQSKLRLLDPVPERAFFAALPPNLIAAQRLVARRRPIRWIGVIAPEYKVAPWLTLKKVPEHARRPGGRVELVVEFFGDVEIKRQQQTLEKHRSEILTRIEPLNGWRVLLAESSIPRLAAEDPVKWIVEVPAQPEDDNDGVRSATGVNADAILPPAPYYNITGSGVVIGQWEGTNASLTHGDFVGRIILADPPIPANDRTNSHTESVAANGQFDNGEAIYRDIDDSANVSAGDVRATAVGAFPAGSVVVAGDADVGTGLVFFNANEEFADTVVADFAYTAGEGIYLDNDNSGTVSVGDTRLTPVGAFAVGSAVGAGDPDIGNSLEFPTNPHYHSTHVAGTAMGSGAQSTAQGGTPNQWKGVALGAALRSYSGSPISATGAPVPADEYFDAAANGVTISTNSWGYSIGGHCHQVFPPNTCYEVGSQYYDSVNSGRRSDGTPSGLAQRILILGSAGNEGRPERHTDTVTVNGQYDNGETIYRDNDDNGVVSAADLLVLVPGQPAGTPLLNFNLNEMHTDGDSDGRYDIGEGIYLDADASRTVTPGDTRIIATGGFPAGSVVALGNGDVGTNLRQFKLWGNVRIPNSAKNTIEVANITSDASILWQSSSRGPTDDGRLKPDLAGPGSQGGGDGGVTSAFPGNLYSVNFGTSMSTPAVAGSAGLLTEWYNTACVATGPTPDAVKVLLIHSSQELANIPNVGGAFGGPDFAFGYGRTRVKEAVDLVPHHRQGTTAAVGDTDYAVTIGTMSPLKVTLVWDDPPWTANAAPSAATGILQNDLDLLLIAPDGTQYTPWQVNATNPFAPATRTSTPMGMPVPAAARDRRNNVEQVVVDNAMPGTWTIRVTASMLNLPPQSYTLVSEVLPPQASPCTSAPAADVWMRDNPSDTGAVPSSGNMWEGPDHWNRYAPDWLTTHQNPEYGQVNYLYANIRNATAVTVRATSLDFWIAEAALGLTWPDNFKYIGRISVPNLTPNEVRQVGPFEWNPPSPSMSNHFCMLVRVTGPQDPITFAETSSIWTNAMNSNNIVYRNLIIVDLMSSRTVPFLVRNVEEKEADVDIVFQIPEDFLRRGEVYLHLPPEIERRWPKQFRKVDGLHPPRPEYQIAGERLTAQALEEKIQIREGYRSEKLRIQRQPQEPAEPERIVPPPYQITGAVVRIRGIRLGPHQAERLALTFRAKEGPKAAYEVRVIEQVGGETVGGILFLVRTGQTPDR